MERQFSKIGPFTSEISIMTMLNYLYVALFARDYDENYTRLLKTALGVTDVRSRAEPLVEDV